MTALLLKHAFAALLILAAVCPAAAQGTSTSYDFRGTTRGGRQGVADHIWSLQADGRITGQSTERRGGGMGGYSIELSDTGRWQIRQNQLCIEWNGPFRRLNGCYDIERRQGNRVGLNGPNAFDGELDPLPPLQ